MRCILFRSGGSQIDVALPVRDNGNPPDWLEVDGIHYKCQGRVDAVTGWIFQEKEKAKDGVTMAFGNEPVLQTLQEVKDAAAGWFDKIPTGPGNETVQPESYAFNGLKYHIDDGVASPAVRVDSVPAGERIPSIKDLEREVAYWRDLYGPDSERRDRKIADLEALLSTATADARSEKKQREMASNDASFWKSKAVERDREVSRLRGIRDRLREEIQRIQLCLADACKDRDEWRDLYTSVLRMSGPYAVPVSSGQSLLRKEVERLSTELIAITKERDGLLAKVDESNVVTLEVHEEEVARLKGIIERLRRVRQDLEAEIRLLREGSDPQLFAKELEIQRLKSSAKAEIECAIRVRDAAKADEKRATKYAESLMDKIQKIREIARK